MTHIHQENEVAYMQDGEFLGFVELEGAAEIKHSAKAAGWKVEDHGHFFNVVYKKGISINAGED